MDITRATLNMDQSQNTTTMIENNQNSEMQLRFEYPDLGDFGQIFDALQRRDDALLWELARTTRSQEQFFNQLRNEVGFTSYQTAKGQKRREALTHHCAMMMMPVILTGDASELINKADAVEPTIRQVVWWLREWFEYKVDVAIFNAPVPYEEVCIWTPSIMREKLEQLSVKREPTLALAPDFNLCLPPGAPRLSFFVTCAQQIGEGPRLPDFNAQADDKLVSRVRGALQVLTPGERLGEVGVLVPDFASESMSAGLLEWIKTIHMQCGIGRWDAVPVDQDLVVLHLEVGENPSKTSPIPLRAHQLGLDGIRSVVEYVAAIGSGTLAHTLVSPGQSSFLN